MNERIKELYQKAHDVYQWDYPSSQVDPTVRSVHTSRQFNPEKFAELIVFECVNAAMDGTKEGDHYAQKIEQHFDNSTGGIIHFKIEELIDFEKLIREDARCTTGDWVATEVIEYVRKYVRNVPNGDIKKQIESAFYETAHQ